MDRRTFLAIAGAGLSGTAGCGSGTDGGTATPTDDGTATASATPTPTATSTPTETPTRTPPEKRYQPQLLDVSLVSTWGGPGDLEANRIESIRRGQPAVVAFRYRLRVPDGTINLKEGVDVFDGDDLVVRRFRDKDRRVNSAGLHTWEDAMSFKTAGWPTGDLRAAVAIGELQLHRTSETISISFEVRSE